MPTIDQIISGLAYIVNEYSLFAILWHAAIYILITALILKKLPTDKLFTLLLCLPLISVAIFAWLAGNPFNTMVFSIAAILIFSFGLRAEKSPVTYSHSVFVIAGILMVIFGLVYPHFIKTDSLIQYLYSSPAGLIPCPTISILIGFALIYNGFNSKAVTVTLIILGLFYGFIGVAKLAVYLDFFLILGAGILLTEFIISPKVTPRTIRS